MHHTGFWKSPIASDLIVAQAIGLLEVRLDGRNVYWLESRPQERGRNVVVCGTAEASKDVPVARCSSRILRISACIASRSGRCTCAADAGGRVALCRRDTGRKVSEKRSCAPCVPPRPPWTFRGRRVQLSPKNDKTRMCHFCAVFRANSAPILHSEIFNRPPGTCSFLYGNSAATAAGHPGHASVRRRVGELPVVRPRGSEWPRAHACKC